MDFYKRRVNYEIKNALKCMLIFITSYYLFYHLNAEAPIVSVGLFI